MTTPIPTSNVGTQDPGGVAGLSPSTPPLPATGAGLPDALDLQRMASAFFRALPGADAAPGVPASGLQSAKPTVGSELRHSTPGFPAAASTPHSAPRESTVTSGLPSIPSAYAPALPALDAPLAPPSAASYYFLDHTKTPDSAADPLDSLARQGVQGETPSGSDHVSAQSFHLPGQESLRGLGLGGASVPSTLSTPSSNAPTAPAALPHFSFLDGNEASRDPRVIGVPLGGYSAAGLFDVQAIRRDFPILAERVNGKPLVWFDNAATTQKPQAVIDRIAYFYAHENSNIHRAAHELAARATDAYEAARRKVADFLGAKGPEEIIFVRGATEGVNLLAATFGEKEIGEGDEILVSHLEHHANIVPWHRLAERKRAKLRVIPVDDSGQILLGEYSKLLNPRTKLVAITQVSNALGTVTPVAEIIALAHAAGARVLVDGAQAVSHMPVNVQALDADFYVFSGHKVFGPTGIGAVYGKKALLDALPPYQGGGNMIADVTFDQIQYQPSPFLFEAGTGNIADAVGLGAAIDYVQGIGMERINQYEHQLLEYATARLGIIPGVRLIGTAHDKAGVLSFVLDGYKTDEVGQALNREGVAVRTGHHCAQPILRRFGLEATVRPSLAFYNTCEEVDTFIKVIRGLSGRRA
jgi:cysteine desulfurase/selenocysteine lyase